MRLPPLPADQWDDEVRASLSGMLPRDRRNPDGAGTAISTLVRHPALAKAYFTFSVHLLFRSTLPARLRELVILRVAEHHDCAYERRHHLDIAWEAGIDRAEAEAALKGLSTDAFEQRVLDAVDELHRDSRVSEATWTALAERLDERQLMDLVFTVGCYGMTAMAFNTFGVLPEEDQPEEEK